MPTESNFWKQLKRNLPKKTFVQRLENKSGGGVPDVFALVDGLPVWLELKVAKSNKVIISPHQIAWHVAHPKNTFILAEALGPRLVKLFHGSKGGKSFFLVRGASAKDLFLFGGEHGSELLRLGLPLLEDQGSRFEDFATLFETLRADLRPYYNSL